MLCWCGADMLLVQSTEVLSRKQLCTLYCIWLDSFAKLRPNHAMVPWQLVEVLLYLARVVITAFRQ